MNFLLLLVLTKNFKSNNLPDIDVERSSSIFDFCPISSSSIYKNLVKLPNKKGLDVLRYDNALLKIAAPVISEMLTFLFNLSIYTCIVPKDWKKAMVTPIYKGKGDKDTPSNYRPISIIATISKIFETVIKDQIVSYLNVNNIISPDQSAYLCGRSTQTALHSIINELSGNMDKGYVNAICTLDMAKGFDTVSHDILIHKLSFYGFSVASCNFFTSYLSERFQQVKGSTSISSELPINMGVPQGSILGPMLFLIYVNDMPSIVKDCKCHLYADDTTLYCKARTVDGAEKCIQHNLDLVSKWLSKNRLIVNVSKSNVMFIGSKSSINECALSASLNGSTLAHQNDIKLLGLNIDTNLNWKQHISSLCKKISPKIGLLHIFSNYLHKKQLVTIYTALIQSHFDYALSVWGSCHKTYLINLQRMQNRCAHICTNTFDYTVSSSSLIKQLKWMDIATRFSYFIGILMFKFVNGLLPPTLKDQFTFVKDIHSFSTRSSFAEDIALPKCRTEFLKRTLCYTGPKLWNSLPLELKNSSSIESFKSNFKNFLLQ